MNHGASYEELVKPIEEQMIGVVWRIVRNPDDFDDAFQEATVKIWRQIERIKRHANPHALILRICVNAAYDLLRKNCRRRKKEVLGTIPDTVLSACNDPSRGDRRQRVLEAISRLPRNQAQSILMHYIQGFSYSEIAQALGCTEGTVHTHMTRGRRRLCHALSDFCSDR